MDIWVSVTTHTHTHTHLSMWLHVYIHECINMYIYNSTHTHTYIYIYIYACVLMVFAQYLITRVFTFINIYTHVCMHAFVYVCVHVCVCVGVLVCVYVCIFILKNPTVLTDRSHNCMIVLLPFHKIGFIKKRFGRLEFFYWLKIFLEKLIWPYNSAWPNVNATNLFFFPYWRSEEVS